MAEGHSRRNMAARKHREREREKQEEGQGHDMPFKGTPSVTYNLQLGPIS
jgi:hypothetical protein